MNLIFEPITIKLLADTLTNPIISPQERLVANRPCTGRNIFVAVLNQTD